MASKVCEDTLKLIKPIVEDLGYFIVDIEYSKKFDGMNLEITIDSPNGVDIDDCEKVHRAIDAPLDELNPTQDLPYILSVSSPGLDRPIKNEYDFIRNKDKPVEVKLYSKVDGKKVFTGILKEFSEQFVIIDDNGLLKKFSRDVVANIAPIIEF